MNCARALSRSLVCVLIILPCGVTPLARGDTASGSPATDVVSDADTQFVAFESAQLPRDFDNDVANRPSWLAGVDLGQNAELHGQAYGIAAASAVAQMESAPVVEILDTLSGSTRYMQPPIWKTSGSIQIYYGMPPESMHGLHRLNRAFQDRRFKKLYLELAALPREEACALIAPRLRDAHDRHQRWFELLRSKAILGQPAERGNSAAADQMLASLFADAAFREHKNSDHAQDTLLLLAAFLRCKGLHGEIGAIARRQREIRDEVCAPNWDERSAYRSLIATAYNPQALLTALIATSPDPEAGFKLAGQRGATVQPNEKSLAAGVSGDAPWNSVQIVVVAPHEVYDALVEHYVN